MADDSINSNIVPGQSQTGSGDIDPLEKILEDKIHAGQEHGAILPPEKVQIIPEPAVQVPTPPEPKISVTPGTVQEQKFDAPTPPRTESISQTQNTSPHIIPMIHTLKSDMGEAFISNSSSAARIAIQDEQSRRVSTSSKVMRALFLILIFGFFGGGIGVAGYLAYKSQAPQTAGVVAERAPEALISANTKSELDITGMDQGLARGAFQKAVVAKIGLLRPDTIEQINIVRRAVENEKTYVIEVSGPQFLRLVAGEAVEKFVPFLQDHAFFGIHASPITTSGFIIIKTNFFQDTFAELLNWESSIVNDLYPMLAGEDTPDELTHLDFKDKVINNTDARVLVDSDGNTRMIYSFMGTTDTIYIGMNEDSFKEVLTRMKNPGRATQ